ncbi:MAG: hypothetical protein IPH30_14200 [Betaproteobacteria bacterium]|nr:hypothetical protein [Betaproteobacteria bacterium]
MSAGRKILLLHDAGDAPEGLDAIAEAMRALGDEVVLRPCAEPYDAVLDALAAVDSVVFWR